MRIAATSRAGKQMTPEAIVSAQVKDYMLARGWRAVRMQSGLYQGPATTFRSGEPGMPDWLFLRPNMCYAFWKADGETKSMLFARRSG